MKAKRHPSWIDLTGQRLGTWLVLSESRTHKGNAMWLCRHECGAEHVVPGIRLRSEPPESCPSCRRKR